MVNALRLKRTQHLGTNLPGSTEPLKVVGSPFLHRGIKRKSSPQRGTWHRRPLLARLRGRTTPLLVLQETGQPGTGRHTLAAVGLRGGGVQPASPHA